MRRSFKADQQSKNEKNDHSHNLSHINDEKVESTVTKAQVKDNAISKAKLERMLAQKSQADLQSSQGPKIIEEKLKEQVQKQEKCQEEFTHSRLNLPHQQPKQRISVQVISKKQLMKQKLKSHQMKNHEIQQQVPFQKLQIQRLRQYFKHLCLQFCSYPKDSTFDNVKNSFTTISLPEWMLFCKYLQITHEFKKLEIGVKTLSSIFKKYQDIQKRVNFDCFVMMMREVILQFLNCPSFEGNDQQKMGQALAIMCLDSKKKHLLKLKQMGMNCILQSDSPKQSKSNITTSFVSDNPLRERNTVSSNGMQISRITHYGEKQFPSISKKPPPKVYKTNLQRKQSRLLHNLGLSNLHKLSPDEQIKNKIGRTSQNDDKFLKQYFNKQQKIKDGLAKKLNPKLTQTKSQRIRL